MIKKMKMTANKRVKKSGQKQAKSTDVPRINILSRLKVK